MNKKKKMLLLLLSVCFIAVISIYWAPPTPPPSLLNSFEQSPPLVSNIWVQQLKKPINGNSLMIQIQYKQFPQQKLPLQLPVYLGQNTITLYDDGTNGDPVSGDGIYTGTVNEDPSAFANAINTRIQAINKKAIQQGVPFLTFAGHLGKQILPKQLAEQITFNAAAFNSFARVPLSPLILSPEAADMESPCGLPPIINQQSLFITDLSVVEDPARTFNAVTGVGNPTGNWTFGTMIKNMTGGAVTAKDLLVSWFQNYVNPVVVNSQTINSRVNFVANVIAPWLVKIGVAPDLASVTPDNWQDLWNMASEDKLLEYAPFKLTAIVNRLDLLGNSVYSSSISNPGETRFIFTLIDPIVGDLPGPLGLGNNGFITGMPPLQIGNEKLPGVNFLDWKGMNIIFEYGNVQDNLCDVVNFANKWVKLSSYSFPSASYNAALESITTTVTNMGAAPGKPNKSAINRIRSNERINDLGSPISVPDWETSDWEFRQFELDKTGFFQQVPLTNTPLNSANAINNTTAVIGPANTDVNFPFFPINPPNIPFNTADQDNLMDWIFNSPANIADIIAGNINIPVTWAGQPLLSGGARVDYEFLHYIDLNWNSNDANYTSYASSYPVSGDPQYKLLRQQVSLNSCQGCHNGETKTIFTHVHPIGYGVSAKYWAIPPDFTQGQIDERFVSKADPLNYPNPPNPENVVNVSAFLTGENFRQPGGMPAGYFDDFVDATEDPSDPTMNGLFYVNAPDNYATNAINLPTYLFGYNDLQRRNIDLALIACTNCETMKTVPLLQILIGVPLPKGGH